jgi:AraC-like DNA-binding protein
MDGLVFGWRTAVLSMAIAQLLAIAIALTRPISNRTANRTLAALLVALAGIVTPWAIGFAGFYDRWQWLTFAPFAITLAVGPLLWLYGHALIEGAWPRQGWRHLMPALAQLLFLTAGFLLPMPLKSDWASVALPPYGVVTNAGTVIGLVLYGAAGLRLLARYRARLAEQRSDDARFASRWLSRSIGATLVLLPVWAGYALYDAIQPLGYLRLMGLHLAIAGFALYLAIEGWRHAALPFPRLEDAPAAPEPEPVPLRDWRTLGEHWAEQTRAAGWASDPELTLARLARHLGTNSSYLSRALNEGLGLGFSAFVNRLRSATVADALKAGDRRDLLELAFDAGFASKASFNRAFRAEYGMSPSAYRRVSEAELSPAP